MDDYKFDLFGQADVLYVECREAYEMNDAETAEDLLSRFYGILAELQKLGWDKEYMGIA